MIRKIVLHLLVNLLALGGAFFALMSIDTNFSFTLNIMSGALLLIILTLVNFFIKPLLKLFSTPFIFLTMGLFMIVVNALVLYIAEYIFEYVLQIQEVSAYAGEGSLMFSDWWSYLIAGVVISVVNWILGWMFDLD